MTEPIVYDEPPPDWLHVGAPVVVIHFRSSGSHLIRTEVTKLTKQDIVLADGQRFRHASQTRRLDDDVFYLRHRGYDVSYLYAPDSKGVADHNARQAQRATNDRVLHAARALSGGYVTGERIDAMAAAIDEWRAANPETETEQEN